MMHLPLIGIIGGGAPGGILVFDTFTDADDTELFDHTPDIDFIGSGWFTESVDITEIQNNQATPPTTFAAYTSLIETGQTFVEVTADFTWDGDAGVAAGLWVRSKIEAGSPPPTFTGSSGYLIAVSFSGTANPVLRILLFDESFFGQVSLTMTGKGPLTNQTLEIKASSDSTGIHGEMTIDGTTFNVDLVTTNFDDGEHLLHGMRLRGGTSGPNTIADNFKIVAI